MDILFNLDTMTMRDTLSFLNDINRTSDLYISPNNIAMISANNTLDKFASFDSSIVLKIPELPLESYDNGVEDHILSFMPSDFSNPSIMKYLPSPINHISLNNNRPTMLSSLTVRLENEDGGLVDDQESCSVVILITEHK